MLLDFGSPFKRLRSVLTRRQPVASAQPPDIPCPLTHPDRPLPAWVADDEVVQSYRALLGGLPWADFPERPAGPWPGPSPDPRAPFVAAFLIKLHEEKRSMAKLRTFLIKHPALVYWLGFPRVSDPTAKYGFNVAATVPDHRQLSRVLRLLPDAAAAFLLTATIQLLKTTLSPDEQATFGDTIAGDTQGILAWVRENNPKEYIEEGRLDKTRQPKGDPDCKLGVKKRRNSSPEPTDHPTPTTEATPANALVVGSDIFWGYGTGIVVTKLPSGTEIVLAHTTRTFNESDISYFFPLMEQVEARLGRRPRVGIWDTAYDAHYVYDYFHQADGMAIIPMNVGKRGGDRQFDPAGLPLCAAGLGMPIKFAYWDKASTLVPHERGKHVCPLLFPAPTGEICPIADPHWAKGGCTTTIATSAGARIRLQIDRESDNWKRRYDQRTMVERINSQAAALNIMRPKVRNRRSIANQNTLTYVLINLRALQREQARNQQLALSA